MFAPVEFSDVLVPLFYRLRLDVVYTTGRYGVDGDISRPVILVGDHARDGFLNSTIYGVGAVFGRRDVLASLGIRTVR